MVPKVAQAGRSFKGAALYYLHDKKANTSDRVAFTETLNLPTNNADQAVAHMIDTAAHSEQLKAANGIKTGRKLEKPVYAYSLAWHPSEAPTQAEQIEAARESLQALGLTDRQALIVSHNDTDHPHVHVIVNRVCPDTGKAASIRNDRRKLSQWANEYEKRRGKIFCEARDENEAKRNHGQWVKDDSPTRQDWIAWKKAQTASVWAEYRQDRDTARADRKGMYDALWRQREERFALRKDEIKHLYRPIWRDVFKRQEDQVAEFDAGAVGRLRVAARTGGMDGVRGFARVIFNSKKARAELVLFHAAERKDLSQKQRQRIHDASREVTKAWKYDRDQLRAVHKDQDKARLDQAKATTDALWKDKSMPSAREQADAAQQGFEKHADRRREENKSYRDTLSGKDRDYIEQAREEQRKQKERNKKRKRNRTRNRDDGGRTMT